MTPSRPADWRINAFKAYNGAGVVLVVLAMGLAALLAFAKFPETSPLAGQPPLSKASWALAFLVPCLGVSLLRIDIEIWTADKWIRRRVGIWPLFTVQEVPMSPTALEFTADRAKHGPIFRGRLIQSTGKPVTLLVGGSADDLKPLAQLADRLGVPVHGGKGMDKYCPAWLSLQSEV